MGRDRVGKEAQFTHVCSGVNVDSFRVIVDRRVSGSEVRWEPSVHRQVHEFCGLREEQFTDVVQFQTSLLHCIGDCHSLEITTVMDFTSLTVNERIVGSCMIR